VLLRTAHEANQKIPVRIAVCIASQVLAGLHAAHTTVDEMGAPLNIVHRDVSPQNVMIAVDGSARLLDFGVAKATMAAHVTRDGTFKGKLAYSAPEQVRGKPVQQSDVYALAVVLWELLVGHRMHGSAQGEAELVATIMGGSMPTITEALSNEADWGAIDSDEWKMLSAIEPIVAKGLNVELDKRYKAANEMEKELTKAVPPASTSEVAAWVRALGKDFIEGRDKLIAAEEQSWRRTHANIATMPGRRLTPLPGELRRPQTLDGHGSIVSAPQPTRGGGKAIIAVLGALVVLLGIGVVFAMQSGGDRPQPTAAPTEPAHTPTATSVEPPPPAAAEPAPVIAPEAKPAATEPAKTETPVATSTEPAPAAKEEAKEEKPVSREAPPARRPQIKPAPRPVVKQVATKKEKEEPPPPPVKPVIPEAKPAAAEPPPKNECNPPYYFEGQKKVFKPNCL